MQNYFINHNVIQKDDFLAVINGEEYNYNNIPTDIIHVEIIGNNNKRNRSAVNVNNLHQNVKFLHIEHSDVESIDFLPTGLEVLEICDTNKLNYDNLPDGLKKLCIYYNVIDNLNNLPPKLEYLFVCCCNILDKNISNLPKNLKVIKIHTGRMVNQYIFNDTNIDVIEKENIKLPNDYCVIDIIQC